MAFKCVMVCLALLCCLSLASGKKGPSDSRIESLELTSVTREVDLSSPLVKQKLTMVVENKATKAVSSVFYTVERQLAKKLAYIGAQVQVGKDEMSPAPVIKQSPLSQQDQAAATFKIVVPSLSPGGSVTVVVDAIFFNAVMPFPSSISQSENQLVKFIGSSYVYSPYPSSTQSTTFTLPNANVESFSRVAPTNSADKTITYGPYSDVAALSYSKIEIHFENNGPFLTVAEVERIIEVSHWGNVAVEEHIHIKHIGATLKGSFSRYDFQRNSGASAVKSYTTLLPAAAQDLYYRDEIGNISTSNARTEEEFVSLELRPRFPLFGGWQTRYYYGYNLPSYEYLYHDGSRYMLKMRLLDHVFDDQLVETLTVKIILPEGTKNIDFRPPPYDVELADQEVKLTYLDTVGRPVVVCRAQNLVEQHIQDFELHYTFERMMLLQEPLLIVLALYLFFLFVIVLVRLDFSITKDAAVLARQQASVIIDSIKQAHFKRGSLIQKYRSVITNFKSSKDSGSSNSSKRNLDEEFKKLGEKVSQLAKELQPTDVESTVKVQDIQKKMVEVKTLVDESWYLAEKVVKGSVTKQQYLEQNKKAESKMEKLMQDIESVIQTL